MLLKLQVRSYFHGAVWLFASWLAASAPAQPPDSPALLADAEPTTSAANAGDNLDKLLELADKDVGQLSHVKVAAPSLNIEVTTVSRQKSTIGQSPAAVFVITNEMIRRSGARSIPEALRMAPGVQVARIDASKWAISIRGFNSRFANKLLVQIDGRTVYTPLFAGVFWDVQDVLLEDVERIEVIRGPGATVWGANAVNGVINVITRKAADSQGVFVEAGRGTEQRGFTSARYGGQAGENVHYRVYGKWFDIDEAFAPPDNAHDDWRMARGGLRADWQASCEDTVTFQGDSYRGAGGQRSLTPTPFGPPFINVIDNDARVAGGNALVRWTHTYDDKSDWSVQAYYDRTERELERVGFREDRDTVDIDFQYRFPVGDCHAVICGGGYRNTADRIRSFPFAIEFNPPKRATDLFSYFVQDQVTLSQDVLFLTVGSKFQHNDFTGFEIQPTIRLLWTPDERHSLWSSVSRAVRTPSRADDDVRVTLVPDPAFPGVFTRYFGNRAFDSEALIAYEAGIREQTTETFSWDLALFYHDYSRISSFAPGLPFFEPPGVLIVPINAANGNSGHTYGLEYAANWQLTPCWRAYGAYSLLRSETTDPAVNGSSPVNQIYLQSSWDVGRDWHLDVAWRYVDSLTAQAVPSYHALDARLAWRPTLDLEAAVVARHLLDSHHPEFGNDNFTGNLATQVQQEVYGVLTVRY